jgi:hypothetical protein
MAELKATDQLKGKHVLNEMRDTIHCALEVNRTQLLPCLFLSNPGLGKTTVIKMWCKYRRYELVTLIGAQRTREDVLGYQVNTGTRLETFTPDWFNEIHEYDMQGKPVVLFIDELSTAPEDVQGALLQLIFDRKIGGTKNFLPDSTLIVSAANYKENLPPQCQIMAPTLNRFLLVNLDPVDGPSLAAEFLQDSKDWDKNLVTFENIQITPRIEESARENVKQMFNTLFESYATKNGKGDHLSVHHQNVADIFEKPGKIYNFISGRTISYVQKLALGIIQSGIYHRRFAHIVTNLFLGLVGNGTNNFSDETELQDFRDVASLYFLKVIKKTLEAGPLSTTTNTLDYSKQSIEEAVNSFALNLSGGEATFDSNFEKLVEKISEKYQPEIKNMGVVLGQLKQNSEMMMFIKDMSAIDRLVILIQNTDIEKIKTSLKELEEIQTAWFGYRAMIEKEVLKI